MTIYNISDFDSRYWIFLWLFILFGFVSVAVLNLVGLVKFHWSSRQRHRAMIVLGGTFVIINLFLAFTMKRQLDDARSDLTEGSYKTTVGKLTVVRPQNSNVDEIIEVNGVRFSYNSHLIRPGYRIPVEDSELMVEGSIIIVYYVGNTILRIDHIRD